MLGDDRMQDTAVSEQWSDKSAKLVPILSAFVSVNGKTHILQAKKEFFFANFQSWFDGARGALYALEWWDRDFEEWIGEVQVTAVA